MSLLTVSTLFALATSAPIKPEERIVNGVPVSANTYPWMVSMRKHYLIGNGTYDSGSFCGASLIGVDPPVILTAAHCVDTVQAFTINGTSYEFIANFTIPVTFHVDINRTDPDEDLSDDSWQTLEWTADQLTVHPLYNTSGIQFGYDIALIVIDDNQNLTFSEDDLPLIPNATLDFSESCCADGDALEAIGYGLNHSNGSGTDTLEHTDLEYVNASYCYDTILAFMNVSTTFEIDNRVVCAIGNKTDTCQGDSGGPLFRLTSDSEPEIIGLTSWGLGCAVPDVPAVYTSVAHFYDWISVTAGWTTTAVPTASPTGPTVSPTDYPVMMTTIDSGSGDSDSADQSGAIRAMDCGLLVFVVLISAVSM